MQNQRLNNIINPAVAALGYELVGTEISTSPVGVVLRVYIDKQGGVKLEDCEKASRQISAVLDVEDPLPGKYRLEVSSPGINRPLFTIEHYKQFISHTIKLRLHVPLAGRRNFTGIIQKVENESIVLSVENELVEFKFVDIEKGNLIYTHNG